MIRRELFPLFLGLAVAACGPAPTATPVPTAAPAALPAPSEAAQAPIAEAPAPISGVQRFVIDPAASKVTYEVGEVFIREGNRYNVAVGTTTSVTGEVLVDRADPTRSTVGPIQVDISAFTSDSERRDRAIRERWLESLRFPIATFVPTKIEGPQGLYVDGQELAGKITGDLQVRDVTKQVTFDVTGRIVGDEMTGTATTAFKMSDFGFPPPDIAGMIKAEDDVRITFAFVARAAE